MKARVLRFRRPRFKSGEISTTGRHKRNEAVMHILRIMQRRGGNAHIQESKPSGYFVVERNRQKQDHYHLTRLDGGECRIGGSGERVSIARVAWFMWKTKTLKS